MCCQVINGERVSYPIDRFNALKIVIIMAAIVQRIDADHVPTGPRARLPGLPELRLTRNGAYGGCPPFDPKHMGIDERHIIRKIEWSSLGMSIIPRFQIQKILPPVGIAVSQAAGAIVGTSRQRVKVRHTMRHSKAADRRRPERNADENRGQTASSREGPTQAAHKNENKWEARHHVPHMVIEPGLGTHQRQHRSCRHNEEQVFPKPNLISAGAPQDDSYRSKKQRPGSQRLFDQKSVKVVIPPSVIPPFAPEIGGHPALEIELLAVYPQNVVFRQRNSDPPKRGAREAIAEQRGLRGCPVALGAAEGRGHESVFVESFEGTLETIAQIDCP